MMNNSSHKINIQALLVILQLDLRQDHRLALLLKGVEVLRIENHIHLLLDLNSLGLQVEGRKALIKKLIEKPSREFIQELIELLPLIPFTREERGIVFLDLYEYISSLENDSLRELFYARFKAQDLQIEEESRDSISKEDEWEFLNDSLQRFTAPTNRELDELVESCTSQWSRSRLCESISEKYCVQYYSVQKLLNLQLDEEANFTIFYRFLKSGVFVDEEVSLLKQLNVRDEQLMELMRKTSKNWLAWDEFKELILLSNRLKAEDKEDLLREIFDVNKCSWFLSFLDELSEFQFSADLLGDLFRTISEKIHYGGIKILSLDLKNVGYTPDELKAIFIKTVKVMTLLPDNEMKQLCEKWCCPIEAMDQAIFANEDIHTDYLMKIMQRRLGKRCPNKEKLYYLSQNFMEVFPEKPIEEQALLVQILCTELLQRLKRDLNKDNSFGASFYADRNFEAAVKLYYSDYAYLLPAEKIVELFSLIMIHLNRHGKEWTFIELEDFFRTYTENKPEKCHPLIHWVRHLPFEKLQFSRFAFMLAAFPSNHRLLLRLLPSLELNGLLNYRILKNILKRSEAALIPDISEELQHYELSSTHTLLLLKRALSKADSWGLINLFCHLHDYPLNHGDRSIFLMELCRKYSYRSTPTIIKVLPHLGYSEEEIYIFLKSATKHYSDFNTETIQAFMTLLEWVNPPVSFRKELLNQCMRYCSESQMPMLIALQSPFV